MTPPLGERSAVILGTCSGGMPSIERHYEALSAHGAALCAADAEDSGEQGPPLVPTTSWGYLRLRRCGYTDAELSAWIERVGAQVWDEAHLFFKHEDEAKGPALAERFAALAGS